MTPPAIIALLATLLGPSLLSTADQALADGDFDAAIEAYQEILRDEPDAYEARFGLARALAFTRRYKESLILHTALLDADPDNADVRLSRGRLLTWMGRYRDAAADLLYVTAHTPDYADAWSALGDLYRWTDRLPAAIEAYTRWAEIEPDRPEPFLARARANRDARLFAQARFDLERARGRGADLDLVARELTALDRAVLSFPWELAGRYDYLAFGAERSDWHTGTLRLRRELSVASLAAESIITRRFDRLDEAVAFDAYVDLWRRAYGNLRLQYSPSAEVVPEWDLRAAVFQGLATALEISASYRHMAFANNNINIAGLAFAASIGDWFLKAESLVVPDEGEVGFSASALVRFYYDTVDDFMEVRGGTGRQVVLRGPGRAETRGSHFASVRVQRFFIPRFGAQVSLDLQADAEAPIGIGFGAGLLSRF